VVKVTILEAKKCQLTRYGHIRRMGEELFPKAALEQILQERRKWGRPLHLGLTT
jgi:hypothetical protein